MPLRRCLRSCVVIAPLLVLPLGALSGCGGGGTPPTGTRLEDPPAPPPGYGVGAAEDEYKDQQ